MTTEKDRAYYAALCRSSNIGSVFNKKTEVYCFLF